MSKVLIVCSFITCLLSDAAMAQSGGGVLKGRVLSRTTKAPFSDAQVTIPEQHLVAPANTEGYFSVLNVPQGKHMVIISGSGIKTDTLSATMTGETIDMGELFVAPAEQLSGESADIPTIAVEENTSQEDENGSASSQSSSGFYIANQDPFLYTAAIVFGPYRFKPRGYDNADVQVNGIPLQDLETGFSSLGQIGGLNDVMRDRNVTYGLKPADYSFGTVKGSTYINATAADQRKGTSISYQAANGTYRNRIMATYSSGVNKNGWAYSVSGSRRWAQEGYVAGTFYDGYSFYGAVSKLTKKGQFNLTAFGTPTKRGAVSSEIDEAFDLAGTHYYNSDWGYQDGKKRNAVVSNVFQPSIIANYTYKPSDKTRWNTAIGYQFGQNRRSGIDFYNGYNVSPTYYRNLPYYSLLDPDPNPALAASVQAQYQAHPELLQIQWDNLYQANYMNTQTVADVNGITGNNFTGKRSIYVVRDAVDDLKKLAFNTNITHVVNEHTTVDGGLDVVSQQNEYYKELTDLLGGTYFVNYNQFAAQQNVGNPTYIQNDLNNPNQVIKKGDKYGYDYKLRALQSSAWAQGVFSYDRFDFFIAGEGGITSFSREGLMRNGLFADNSYGKSGTHSFTTYKAKGGFTYKINAKNAVYVHSSYFADAPKIDYTYISDKTRDFAVTNEKTYKTKSFELGYMLKSSIFNLRVTGYVTDVTDNTIVKRFFNDDPAIQSFVNYVMQNVNTRSIGTEIVASARITPKLTATGIIAVGQSFYTNNPYVSIYQDNIPSMVPVIREVYVKNYYLGVGPQSIYSLALKYSMKGNFHANLNLNYMDRNYVEINPDRHTQMATDLVTPGSQQWKDILTQEKLPGAFTTDITLGKSFDISRYYKSLHNRTTLNVNVGVNNLLNNTDIKAIGFQQLRYDFLFRNPDKFPNKYAYAYGINYFLTISLRF